MDSVERFDIVRKLGQGTYGKVQLGINKETGQEVAIKTIKKAKIETEADLIRIRREIQIMSSVRHPNIIHIYEVFENREKMVLVMEYAAGGELYDYLSERKVLAEIEARRIFRQIATAVYYCHKVSSKLVFKSCVIHCSCCFAPQHKICHRDLKLENILLDETGNAKIADFGLSNVFDDRRLLSTFCGSPLYASPEIVKGTPYHGPEVDCWSLGVLLYTLVYGAMPFDGSNFKKLVKQISQGDYFEPKKPSPASPLIRDMLTVTPRKRADVERICSHWWVNEGYAENCLEAAEVLANQTPVRLDLLLSLAPAPSSDKIVVPETKTQETTPVTPLPPSSFPPRSHSMGSLMELDYPGGRKVSPPRLPQPPPPTTAPPVEEAAVAPKRKLQECPSGETGAKRKETTAEDKPMEVDEPAKPKEKRRSIKSKTKPAEKVEEPQPEATESASVSDKTKVKRKKKVEGKPEAEENTVPETTATENAIIPESVEALNESKLPVSASVPAEPEAVVPEVTPTEPPPAPAQTPEKKEESPSKRKPLPLKNRTKTEEIIKPENGAGPRRKSSIAEKAEKFNSMSSSNLEAKKLFIPGVKISDFKKAFEKKSPAKSASASKAIDDKKTLSNDTTKPKPKSESPKVQAKLPPSEKTVEKPKTPEKTPEVKPKTPPETKPQEKSKTPEVKTPEKPKTPPESKLPTPEVKPKSPPKTLDVKPKTPPEAKPSLVRKSPEKPVEIKKSVSPTKPPTPPVMKPEPRMVAEEPARPAEPKKKSATMKIILDTTPKSATLPRRTSKAEIRLNSPSVSKPEYRTEVEHVVGAVSPPGTVQTQRSEVAFPVAAPSLPRVQRPYKHSNTAPTRSMSLEPEGRPQQQPKERIIPIRLEEERPPPVRPAQPQSPQLPQAMPLRRETLSRQSTQESEAEKAIRKSPREYIIPIAMEGGGYVTPRSGSLEPESVPSTPTRGRPRFTRTLSGRRMGLLSESQDAETENGTPPPPPQFQRQNSENESEAAGGTLGRGGFHMHRLRSSRPSRSAQQAQQAEHDSFSSGEEDDEDDGFEILTAESLFSTLLSRHLFRNVMHSTHFPIPLHIHNIVTMKLTQTVCRRLSEHSRLSRTGSGRSSTDGGDQPPTWRRGVSRDASDATADSLYSEHQRGETDSNAAAAALNNNDHIYVPASAQPRRMPAQPEFYTRPQDPYRPMPQDNYRPLPEQYRPEYRHNPEMYRRSYSTAYPPEPHLPAYHLPESLYSTLRQPRRSMSLNRAPQPRHPPEMLNRFLDIREDNAPQSPLPNQEERSRRSRRVSRFLRPDFYDTPREESAYAKQKEDDRKVEEERLREERERHRREEESRGRVTRAITSLQQRASSQEPTESSLLKRAVSSDDCAATCVSPTGKVNSVLGIFKQRLERPTADRFRRAQSVYEPTEKPRSAFTPYQRAPSEEQSVDDDTCSACSELPLEDDEETVSDRILRKSFYTRFNDYQPPKPRQPAKASPAVAAILERDFRRSGHKHRSKQQAQQQQQQVPTVNGSATASSGLNTGRRYNTFTSVPRGWEPNTEAAEFYHRTLNNSVNHNDDDFAGETDSNAAAAALNNNDHIYVPASAQPRRMPAQPEFYTRPQDPYRPMPQDNCRPLPEQYRPEYRHNPEMYRRSYSTAYPPEPHFPAYHLPESLYSTLRQPRRSMSLNRAPQPRHPPEMLNRFLDIREDNAPQSPPPNQEERSRRSRRVSRFLRPDFYDTPREESAYAKQKEDDRKVEEERLREERERQRREEESRGRVTRAITSLQQRASSQEPTESSLLKRAVSSDDCAATCVSPTGKVNSVLGIFKQRLERPTADRFRRAQSVYEPTEKPRSAFTPYQRAPSEEQSVDDDTCSACSELPLEDDEETVSDRILRKSFYTRFNDYQPPKPRQPAKASPAVAAILERDFRRSGHKHRSKQQAQQQQQQVPTVNGSATASSGLNTGRRYNTFTSVPRGWEPNTEAAEFYHRTLNKYGQGHHPSAPLFPSGARVLRPGRPPSPPPDH
ncbi:hypothetical protein B566_EDAN004618 [Ephemera danica]|nr:hypothetical protein B566_EDAN004618 [Ephemera danica]